MINMASGSIFDCKAKALVVPVNAVGVMGAGLAADFNKRFPKQCEAYFKACRAGALKAGGVVSASEFGTVPGGEPELVFAATKAHWKNPSEISWVKTAAAEIVRVARARGLDPIAVPALGCGLGNLRYAEVRPVFLEIFAPYEGSVLLFPPA